MTDPAPSGTPTLFVRILDRYILREILKVFVVVLFVTATLLAIGRIFDKLGDILEAGARMNLGYAAWYILCSLPFELVQAMPLIVTLSLLLSIGGLARNREVIAMLTGGISAWRIATPVIGFGVVLSVLLWIGGEYVVPLAQHEAERIDRIYIRGKSAEARDPEFAAPGIGNVTFYMDRYVQLPGRAADGGTLEEMRNVSIWWVNDETWRLERRLDAPEATYVGDAADGRTKWRFQTAVEQRFEGDGVQSGWVVHDEPFTMNFGPSLDLFLQERRDPEEMNSQQLGNFLEILHERGQSDPRYETDYHLKFAFPLGVVLLSLISFACALRAQYGTFVQGVGQGLLLTTIYFLLTAVMQAIGHSGVGVPGVVCAWFSNVAFLLIALWMLYRVGVAR